MEWRVIDDFRRYEVSENGDVRFAVDVLMPWTNQKAARIVRFPKGKLLKSIVKKPSRRNVGAVPRVGYFLQSDVGKPTNVLAHRLVAAAFCDRADGCNFVCHRDGNPNNNHWSNLYWGTPKQNALDRWKHGTMCNGVKAPAAKLTAPEVLQIRQYIADGEKCHDIAQRFGVKTRTIEAIRFKQNWRWLA